MDYLVDTVEGRIQMALGQKELENLALQQRLADVIKENEDLKARLAERGEGVPSDIG